MTGNSLRSFVFDGAHFVGDFTGLYAAVEDPWQQGKEHDALDKLAALELLSRSNFTSVLEYGCGLGYFTG